jgi:putative flippase GtrA
VSGQDPLAGAPDPAEPAAPTTPSTPAAPEAPVWARGTDGPLLRLVKDRRTAFVIVGGINTAVGLAWFALFDRVVGPHLGYMATLGAAHVASVLCAFVLYRRFVFRVTGHTLLDLGRFEMVNLASLAINAVALPLLVELAGLPPFVAQVLITFVTMVVSYIGHRDFSFRRRSTPRGA